MARHRDEDRFEALRRSLATVGLFRRGSVVRRFMPCGKPTCVCQTDRSKLHGPYYQWTRNVRGKTVTVRLRKEEAELLRKWIANGRQLNKVIAAMERVALRLTQRMLRSTTRT
jgi:hypothetical protein